MKTTQQKVRLVFGVLAVALLLIGACSLTGCKGGNLTSTSMPTADGKDTLAGIDADNDGVRDDVEQYIAESHPNSAKERAALTQYAKVMQAALIDANDKQKSIQHAEEASKAQECVYYTIALFDAAEQSRKGLKATILNTDARNRAYFAYNDQLGGQNFMSTPDSQRASTCAVNPATLPN